MRVLFVYLILLCFSLILITLFSLIASLISGGIRFNDIPDFIVYFLNRAIIVVAPIFVIFCLYAFFRKGSKD